MKTENCCYPKCTVKAEYYCGNVVHRQYGQIMAGWCEEHHPNKLFVEKYAQRSYEQKTNIWENRMGLLRYGKRFTAIGIRRKGEGMKETLTIVFEKDEKSGGYTAYVLEWPHAIAAGRTKADALVSLADDLLVIKQQSEPDDMPV